jgi:glutamine synthetase
MSLLENAILKINESDTKLIRFLFCDNGGVTRSKAAVNHTFPGRAKSGIGVTVAQQVLTPLDMFADIEGFTPAEEVMLIPDLSTFKTLPYTKNSAAVLCDIITAEGNNSTVCPRFFLKRMIKKLKDEFSISLKVSFENEFTLFRKTDLDEYITLDNSCFASTISMIPYEDFILDCIDNLKQQNLIAETYYPESGSGQLELSIKHSSALNAADNQILYKETIRNIAFKHNLIASFAAKPQLNQGGNGCHIHISGWDNNYNNNLFYDPKEEYKLSKTAQYFMAGILKHTSALLALTAPTVNSYKRLMPNSWSSAYTCWGPNNREATLRVLPGTVGNENETLNFEYKPSDPSQNPYLALGALLSAGMNGISQKIKLPKAVLTNPSLISNTDRKGYGIVRYPETLKEALECLKSDKLILNAMGPDLAKTFIGVKTLESNFFSDKDIDFELKNHIFKY